MSIATVASARLTGPTLASAPRGHRSSPAVDTLRTILPYHFGLDPFTRPLGFTPDFTAVFVRAEQHHLADQARLLDDFGKRSQYAPADGRWSPVPGPEVGVAAVLILAAMAQNDSRAESLAAADALVGGLTRYTAVEDLSVTLGLRTAPAEFAELLRLAGERVDADGARLEDLDLAQRHGGLLLKTRLPADAVTDLQTRLRALPFGFVQDVRVPEAIDWRPSERYPGVAYGKRLRLPHDPGDGSLVVPIQVAAGHSYPWHIHVGREDAVFLPGSAPLQDGPGKPYGPMAPGTLHSPSVVLGNGTAMFFGVAEYGVVMLDPVGPVPPYVLFGDAGATPDVLAKFFCEIDLDSTNTMGMKFSPRSDVANALLADLAFVSRRTHLLHPTDSIILDNTIPLFLRLRLPPPQALWHWVLSLSPERRMAWAASNALAAIDES